MIVQYGLQSLQAEWPQAVVCVGTFDGVHLGHQKVIQTAVHAASERELPAILLTFDRNPAAVLRPEKTPAALATIDQNLEHFAKLGIAITVVLPFDHALSETTAEQFLNDILLDRLKAVKVIVGHDFAMGKNRVGTPAWLAQRIQTEVVPPFEMGGVRVSSSAIRALVAAGDVDSAGKLLGRPFALEGIVIAGEKLGRTLGYPTLNLARAHPQAIPGDGIYAGVCRTPYGLFKAAISIGMRPTVKGKHRTIEAYLLDYPGLSLYGASVELSFHQRLRDELDLRTLGALKHQIEADVDLVNRTVSL